MATRPCPPVMMHMAPHAQALCCHGTTLTEASPQIAPSSQRALPWTTAVGAGSSTTLRPRMLSIGVGGKALRCSQIPGVAALQVTQSAVRLHVRELKGAMG